MSGIDEITTIILAGGRGTRLRELYPDTPKPLISIAGKPFLHWLTLWINRHGPKRFIYSTGHLADQIDLWVNDGSLPGVKRTTCREEQPLGTGGALLHCLDRSVEWCLVANGDGLVMGGIEALLDQGRSDVDGALIGIEVEDATRFGSLTVDADGRLIAFQEKVAGHGLINGGLYLFRTSLFAGRHASGTKSLEREILPDLLSSGANIQVVNAGSAPFIDIGTPETLSQAERFVLRHLSDVRDNS